MVVHVGVRDAARVDVLAPGAEAFDHYRAALARHTRGTRDDERARTELLFGSALRRLRRPHRRTEARDRLYSRMGIRSRIELVRLLGDGGGP